MKITQLLPRQEDDSRRQNGSVLGDEPPRLQEEQSSTKPLAQAVTPPKRMTCHQATKGVQATIKVSSPGKRGPDDASSTTTHAPPGSSTLPPFALRLGLACGLKKTVRRTYQRRHI